MINGKKAILVVDHDMRMLNLIESILLGNDFIVKTAVDASDGLIYMNRDVEMVIVNRHIYAVNGMSFASVVKSQYPRVPVVGISTFDREPCYKIPTEFDKIIGRSFVPKTFLKEVNELINKSSFSHV